jgi:hypothetical protein
MYFKDNVHTRTTHTTNNTYTLILSLCPLLSLSIPCVHAHTHTQPNAGWFHIQVLSWLSLHANLFKVLLSHFHLIIQL